MRNNKARRNGRIGPVALAALVITILLGTGGGAVAGAMITGAQIKNGTVTGVDIKDGSVGGRDVGNGSITGIDVRDGSITRADIKDEALVFGAYVGGIPSEELDDFTSDIFVPIVSKSMTVGGGYLHITASVFAQSDTSLGNKGSLRIAVRVDDVIVPGRVSVDTTTNSDFGENGTLTVVVPVSSGSHTVSLVARDDASGSYIYERSVSVVWSAGGSVSGTVFPARRGVTSRSNR